MLSSALLLFLAISQKTGDYKIMKTRKKIIIFTLILIILAGQFIPIAGEDSPKIYINFKEIMEIENYSLVEGYKYRHLKKGAENKPDILIRPDLENNKIYKNDFVFPLDYQLINEQFYIEKKNAEAVFNVNFIISDKGKIERIEPIKYETHNWTGMGNGLIAHAGGIVVSGSNNNTAAGTNSRQAVIQSYDKGHRVFEIDLNLTTDNKLAAVHNWHGYNGPLSSEKWAEVKIWDAFQSMMLEDVLDIMLVNKDMFLVTDTKSFEYTREQIELQFKILVDTAKKKDPELLKRIIPQIYYQEMYDIVMKQHEFESIIYTLYASQDSDAQVVEFVKKHKNIRVVTMGPARAKKAFINELRRADKQVYFFTVNDLEEMLAYKNYGVHGFYTDSVFPGELNNK